MKTILKSTLLVMGIALGVAMGQSRVETNKAELAIPFGVVSGYLVTMDDHLVFVNAEKPDSSFALDRSNIADVRVGDQTMTIRTVKPIREVSEFAFRVSDPAVLNTLARWPEESVSGSAKTEGKEQVTQVYKARHKHVLGGCTGTLVVAGSRISYESIDNIGHSRQWDLASIKELKRNNPYEVEIRPFTGNDYELELLQKGMSGREYQALADTITRERAPR